MFLYNVCSAENLTKRNSVLLLHLVRLSVEQTLDAIQYQILDDVIWTQNTYNTFFSCLHSWCQQKQFSCKLQKESDSVILLVQRAENVYPQQNLTRIDERCCRQQQPDQLSFQCQRQLKFLSNSKLVYLVSFDRMKFLEHFAQKQPRNVVLFSCLLLNFSDAKFSCHL